MRDSEATASAQEGQAAAPARRLLDETARLGDEIYERDIRSKVEADHHGEFVSIDVDSKGWAVSDDLLTAAKRLRELCPDAIDVWSVRVGHRVIGSIGGVGAGVHNGRPYEAVAGEPGLGRDGMMTQLCEVAPD